MSTITPTSAVATMSTVTIDLRKLTHSGIGRYLANIVPGVLPLLRADRIQLLGKPEEIAILGPLPPNTTVWADGSEPHSLAEQRLALDSRLGRNGVLWVPHYNVPLLYSGRLVCTVHDLAPIDLPETFGFAKRALASLLLRHVARNAAAILTPSQYSADRIHTVLRYPAEKITVTPLAVDAHWPSLGEAPAPYAAGQPYLLFVGNLKPNKNLTALLSAMQTLGPASPVLLVAGKTGGFRTADARGRQLAEQLGDRVRLLGAVSDTELIALYRGAAAFVMPSLYEGFGLPVLEAMRYGCPVLASNVTSLPTVAGDAALLFDPRSPATIADAIRSALQPGTAGRLRQAGIGREANFTYAQAIQATAAVLNRVLESTP